MTELPRRFPAGLALLGLGVLVAALAAGGLAAAAGDGQLSAKPVLALGGVAAVVGVSVFADVRRVLLALVLLDLPFQWDVNFAYRADVGSRAGLGGFNVSLTTIALTALCLIWAGQRLAHDPAAPAPRWRAAAVPGAFLGALLLSAVVARDVTVAGFEIALIAQMLVLFVYVASTVRTRADVRFVVVLLLVGLLLEALVSLAGHVSGGAIHVPGARTLPHTPGDPVGARLAGTVGAPNTAGAYFAFLSVLALSLCLTPVDRGLRRLAVVAAVPGALCLALTLSRGAWVGFVVSVVALFVGAAGRRGSRVSVRAMVAIGACAMVVLIPLQGMISARVNGPDAGAAASRVPLLHIAENVIVDHPLLGVGANNFAIVLPSYAGPGFSSDWLAVVHNKYLLMWAEAGLAALGALIALLWTSIARGWRARGHPDPLLGAVAWGLGAAILGHGVHMNFDTFQSRLMTQTLWLGAALLAAPAFVARRRSAPEASR